MEKIIIDSDTTFEEAVSGKDIPPDIKDSLGIIDIIHWSFDNRPHQGQLIVHKKLIDEVGRIFAFLKDRKFPIAKIIPVSKYDWSDEKSMEDNNSSAFNYRFIYMTNELSNHSYGRAIDINPFFNPYVARDYSIHPRGARYLPEKPGTIFDGGPVVEIFDKYGWQWGGRYKDRKDWHHFEKLLRG